MNKQVAFLTTILLASSLGGSAFANDSLSSKQSMATLSKATALVRPDDGQALQQNMAGCGPDRAALVWDNGNRPLGYRCEEPTSD